MSAASFQETTKVLNEAAINGKICLLYTSRAIFGDKAGDVKDASLKASPSVKGVVIDKKLFSRVIKNRSSCLLYTSRCV